MGDVELPNSDLLRSIPVDRWPAITAIETTGSHTTVCFRVQSELTWFLGHFPDQPVLPGVVQIHWAALLGQAVFQIPGQFEKLSQVKFKLPMMPEQEMQLNMEYFAHTMRIKFSYRYGEQEHSTGTIHFGIHGMNQSAADA